MQFFVLNSHFHVLKTTPRFLTIDYYQQATNTIITTAVIVLKPIKNNFVMVKM